MSMSRNPGTIARMADGRVVIIYDRQPLLKEKGKVVVHLVDDRYNPIEENGRKKTLLFDIAIYNELIPTWKAMGKVD